MTDREAKELLSWICSQDRLHIERWGACGGEYTGVRSALESEDDEPLAVARTPLEALRLAKACDEARREEWRGA